MKFLASLALLAATVIAAPAASRTRIGTSSVTATPSGSTTPRVSATPSARVTASTSAVPSPSASSAANAFKLQVLQDPTGYNYNGRYIGSYHEIDDPQNSLAILETTSGVPGTFTLSHGTVKYQAPNGAPWELALVQGSSVASSVDISVSPSSGTQGFSVSKDGLLTVAGPNFGGWFACMKKEADGTTQNQLMWHNTSAKDAIPTNCQSVQLKVQKTAKASKH